MTSVRKWRQLISFYKLEEQKVSFYNAEIQKLKDQRKWVNLKEEQFWKIIQVL